MVSIIDTHFELFPLPLVSSSRLPHIHFVKETRAKLLTAGLLLTAVRGNQ